MPKTLKEELEDNIGEPSNCLVDLLILIGFWIVLFAVVPFLINSIKS